MLTELSTSKSLAGKPKVSMEQVEVKRGLTAVGHPAGVSVAQHKTKDLRKALCMCVCVCVHSICCILKHELVDGHVWSQCQRVGHSWRLQEEHEMAVYPVRL